MTSIIKVDQIQTASGAAPTAAGLGLNVTGSVLQVVSNNFVSLSAVIVSSNAYVAASASYGVTVVPKQVNSRIIITLSIGMQYAPTNEPAMTTIQRDGVTLYSGSYNTYIRSIAGGLYSSMSQQYIDSPATTNAVTYLPAFRSASAASVYGVHNGGDYCITLMEIAG